MMTKNDSRQGVMVAMVAFTFADLVSGTVSPAIEVPQGAILLSGQLVIDEAFDSATSDILIVGDAADDNRYASGVDGQAAGATALTFTGHEYPAQDDVTLTWTGAGTAPSAGSGRLFIEYMATNRSQFTQG